MYPALSELPRTRHAPTGQRGAGPSPERDSSGYQLALAVMVYLHRNRRPKLRERKEVDRHRAGVLDAVRAVELRKCLRAGIVDRTQERRSDIHRSQSIRVDETVDHPLSGLIRRVV